LLVAAILTASGPALADDVDQAKAHFAIGTRAYDAKQFRVAIDAFQAAQRLAPRPAILFSIAQAYRRQYYLERNPRDLRQAVDHYKKYLEQDPQGRRVGEAADALADIEPLAERLGPEQAEPATEQVRPTQILIAPSVKGATASVDGGPPIDLPGGAKVTPGKHAVVIRAKGYIDERREVDVAAGDSFPLDVRMIESPSLLSLESDDGVRLYVDGRLAATTPLAKPLELQAGPHVLSATQRGSEPVTLTLDLGPGETKTIAPDFDMSLARGSSFVFMGVGIAATIAGGVCTGAALYEESVALDIEEKLESTSLGPADREAHESAAGTRTVFRNVAIGTLVGGGVLTLTGVLLFVLDDPGPGSAPDKAAPAPKRPSPGSEPIVFDVSVVPAFGPGFGAMTLTGKF
jgi:tetratricopeptide (TPR) repeat protein